MARKRVSAGSMAQRADTDVTCVVDEAPMVPLLNHLTDGATVIDVHPESCIPLFLNRELCENAVLRLAAIINGTSNNAKAGSLTSMVSGAPSSIVVPLTGELAFLVDEHIEKLSRTSDRQICTETFKARFDVWHGIVDGCQMHGAILHNMKEFPGKWGAFLWRVLLLRPVFEVEDYRKLAIAQNERNRQEYHFETTVHDCCVFSVSVTTKYRKWCIARVDQVTSRFKFGTRKWHKSMMEETMTKTRLSSKM